MTTPRTITTDSRGRLDLGTGHADRRYTLTEFADGSITLAPVTAPAAYQDTSPVIGFNAHTDSIADVIAAVGKSEVSAPAAAKRDVPVDTAPSSRAAMVVGTLVEIENLARSAAGKPPLSGPVWAETTAAGIIVAVADRPDAPVSAGNRLIPDPR